MELGARDRSGAATCTAPRRWAWRVRGRGEGGLPLGGRLCGGTLPGARTAHGKAGDVRARHLQKERGRGACCVRVYASAPFPARVRVCVCVAIDGSGEASGRNLPCDTGARV